MRALQLEKIPEWPMKDLNIGWKIDQPEISNHSKSSPRSPESSVILLANSREINSFVEPKISRLSKDGWSDVSDTILANFVEGQSSRLSHDWEEELGTCASDLELWKTNELFTPNWKFAKNQIVRVNPEKS